MCRTARTSEHKCKFDKNTARTSEYNENLSLIPPGTVSIIGNLSRILPVSIKENVVEQQELVSINTNSTRTLTGAVTKILKLSRIPPRTVSIIKNFNRIPPGPMGINTNVTR